MEMDRQTIIALCSVIVGLTLFGGVYLSSPKREQHARPTYAVDDIRYKFQKEDAKKPKTKKAPVQPTYTSSNTGEVSSDDDVSSDEPQEEPSVSDHPPQEEPEIE